MTFKLSVETHHCEGQKKPNVSKMRLSFEIGMRFFLDPAFLRAPNETYMLCTGQNLPSMAIAE